MRVVGDVADLERVVTCAQVYKNNNFHRKVSQDSVYLRQAMSTTPYRRSFLQSLVLSIVGLVIRTGLHVAQFTVMAALIGSLALAGLVSFLVSQTDVNGSVPSLAEEEFFANVLQLNESTVSAGNIEMMQSGSLGDVATGLGLALVERHSVIFMAIGGVIFFLAFLEQIVGRAFLSFAKTKLFLGTGLLVLLHLGFCFFFWRSQMSPDELPQLGRYLLVGASFVVTFVLLITYIILGMIPVISGFRKADKNQSVSVPAQSKPKKVKGKKAKKGAEAHAQPPIFPDLVPTSGSPAPHGHAHQ